MLTEGRRSVQKDGGAEKGTLIGDRTQGHEIKGLALCQLSYEGRALTAPDSNRQPLDRGAAQKRPFHNWWQINLHARMHLLKTKGKFTK